jgi:hypothetical protein
MSKAAKRRTLQLPRTGRADRRVFRPSSRIPRWRQLLVAFALGALGAALLILLLQLPDRFDTVLVLSQALSSLVAGVRQFVEGLLQLVGLVLLVLLALLALALQVIAAVRLVRALAPQPRHRRRRS